MGLNRNKLSDYLAKTEINAISTNADEVAPRGSKKGQTKAALDQLSHSLRILKSGVTEENEIRILGELEAAISNLPSTLTELVHIALNPSKLIPLQDRIIRKIILWLALKKNSSKAKHNITDFVKALKFLVLTLIDDLEFKDVLKREHKNINNDKKLVFQTVVRAKEKNEKYKKLMTIFALCNLRTLEPATKVNLSDKIKSKKNLNQDIKLDPKTTDKRYNFGSFAHL